MIKTQRQTEFKSRWWSSQLL